MITLEQAKALAGYETLYLAELASGDVPLRVRVASKVKTWKRDPGRVEFSAKWGLRDWLHYDQHDLPYLYLDEQAAYLAAIAGRKVRVKRGHAVCGLEAGKVYTVGPDVLDILKRVADVAYHLVVVS